MSATPRKKPAVSIYGGGFCPAWYVRQRAKRRVASPRHRQPATGCVGVTYTKYQRANQARPRRYFSASAAGTVRQFCIDTLGLREAWRRALRFRARYETAVKEGRSE